MHQFVQSEEGRRLLATVEDRLSDEQVESFHADGFLIVEEGFVSDATVELLRERFDALFTGEYGTGIAPDEVNWKYWSAGMRFVS